MPLFLVAQIRQGNIAAVRAADEYMKGLWIGAMWWPTLG